MKINNGFLIYITNEKSPTLFSIQNNTQIKIFTLCKKKFKE
jgi:hypothetical protein